MSTTLPMEAVAPPLRTDECGTVRIGNSRVTLHTIINAYRRGDSPEEIAASFPTVTQAQVYATITYYLSHRVEVDAHLEAYDREAEAMRRQIESQPGYQEWRRYLLAQKRHLDIQTSCPTPLPSRPSVPMNIP